jgi:arabinogalactan oligomer/maltooligosaccharide transport system substrate-binding protein
MYDLKYTDKIMPTEADYNVADGLFKDGKAAMIINGDWTLAAYAEVFGDKLGVGPLPQLTGADYPAPYVAGTFLMVAKPVADNADMQTVVADFIAFATGEASQVDMVKTLKRLPGNASAIEDAVVIGDPLLGGAALAATKGVPQPTNLEMRCVFDSATAAVRDMYTGNSDIAGIVATMQTATETCISQL